MREKAEESLPLIEKMEPGSHKRSLINSQANTMGPAYPEQGPQSTPHISLAIH